MHLFAYTNCSHSPVVEDAWRHPTHEQADGVRDLSWWRGSARDLSWWRGSARDLSWWRGSARDLSWWRGLARELEAGAFDGLFFADSFNVADRYDDDHAPALRRGEQVPEYDPLPL